MWLPIVFWVALLPLVIILIVTFVKTGKLYGLFYVLSVFTYVIAMAFAIDAYGTSKTTILLILVLSAVVMIMLGTYFAKRKKTQKAALPRPQKVVKK
ncbi:MAG: hypothetical protein ABIE94_07040 [archaeon]